jgi:hypothetical protein
MNIISLSEDLRFIHRVLSTNAPEADKQEAIKLLSTIRKTIYNESKMKNIIYVKTDFVPERHKGNIVPGKIYKAIKDNNDPHDELYNITSDLGYTLGIVPKRCSFLDGKSWDIVEVKKEAVDAAYEYVLEKTITVKTKNIVLVKLLKKFGFNYKLSELGRLL